MNREVCEHFEPIDFCDKCNEGNKVKYVSKGALFDKGTEAKLIEDYHTEPKMGRFEGASKGKIVRETRWFSDFHEITESTNVISDQAQDFAKKNELTILFAFDILHRGWEMDFEGLVCRDKMGYNVLVVGDHASFQIQKNNDILKQKIKEYEKAIKQTRSALGWLETK